MSSSQDITNEMRSDTEGDDCRTESENQPAQARACDDDLIDMIIHHNERGKKKPEPAAEQGPAPKTEQEPDYDAEGMIPSN